MSRASKKQAEADPYSSFARIYDQVMDHVDYRAWAAFIHEKSEQLTGHSASRVLDIACGSGQLLKRLRSLRPAAYTGLDLSPEMLEIAALVTLKQVKLVEGDMLSLPFADGSFDLVTNTHDSVNYLLKSSEVEQHFTEVKRCLVDRGIYWCDLTTEANILKYFHKKTHTWKKGDIHLKWSNHYNSRTRIIESNLRFRNTRTNEEKTEIHFQKYYEPAEIEKMASRRGLVCIARYSDYEDEYNLSDCSLVVLVFQKL